MLVDGPPRVTPRRARFRLGGNDIPKHVRYDCTDDIVQGDVPFLAADVPLLVLQHTGDSVPRLQNSEKMFLATTISQKSSPKN